MTLTHEIVQSFVEALEEALPYAVTIVDTNGYIIGSSEPDRLNRFHPSAFEILCDRQPIETWDLETGSYVNLPEGVLLGYGEKIVYEGECIGLIGLVGSPEEIKQSIKTAQLMLHLLLDRKRARDELQLIAADKNTFLLRLLRGQYGSEEWAAERAVTYGITLPVPRCALVVQADLFSFKDQGPLELSRIRQAVKQMVQTVFSSPEDLIYEYDTGEIVALTASNLRTGTPRRAKLVEKAAASLYAALKRLYDVPILIGIGEECADHTGIPLSLRQARTAAEIGSRLDRGDGICFHDQMRLERIVADFSPEIRPILQKNILDKLLEAKEDGLLETLRVYFEQNGSVSETAQRLFIHRNTLQYRFRQVREITGLDVHNVNDLVQLRLAVLQHQYFRGR